MHGVWPGDAVRRADIVSWRDLLPRLPADLPSTHRARGTFHLRYEDIAQDGRLVLEAATPALGQAVWRPLIGASPLAPMMVEQGVIPILTRLVIEGTPGPFSTEGELTAHGAYQLAHARDARGEVERLFLNMWAELTAPIGKTHGPPPPRAGEIATASRLCAEHVFTRLFAPPDQRRVTRFDAPGVPDIPEARYAPQPLGALLELPEGAVALEERIRVDPTPIAFGLGHTDSNQHVNSLVYPRLFEDAALRRFAELGRSTSVLARAIEIGFRKPCFAGQSMRIALRAFALGDRLGACGAFVTEKDAAGDLGAARPHAYVRTLFEA